MRLSAPNPVSIGRVNAEKSLDLDSSNYSTGANVNFTVKLTGNATAAYTYITLYPEEDDVPPYYGKTDSDGRITFEQIEPGTYKAIFGYGDPWYDDEINDTSDQSVETETLTFSSGDNIESITIDVN